MYKERKGKHFIKNPIYEGGLAAMRAFIRENLNYPDEALKKKIEGVVYIRYTIDYKGNVIATKVISGLGHGCDEEAERLVMLFKFQAPKNRGIKIKFFKTIQIKFRLKKETPKPETPLPTEQKRVIQYNLVKKKKDATTKDSDGKNDGYNYTIKY